MIERWTAGARITSGSRDASHRQRRASIGYLPTSGATRSAGLGKPEPLRGTRAGWWSRRIAGEHRLVYRVVGKGAARELHIAQCRYHY